MPRTMAVIGFTFFFSLWIFLETSQTVALISAVAAVAGFTVSMIISSLRREAVFPSIFLTVLAASILFTVQLQLVYKPALSVAGEDVSVKGELCELPYVNTFGRYCYVLETHSIDNVSYSVRILLSSNEKLDAEPCDVISFVGDIYVRGGEEAEIRDNLMSGGVWLGAYPKTEVTVKNGNKSLNYYLLKTRQFAENTILKALPKSEASVLIALLLGNTSYMSDGVYDNSMKCGILHIFAVSGFNLSLFSMSLLAFLERRKAPRFLSTLLPMMIVLLIMAITGFSQSCVRAGIMLLTLLVGKLFSQRTDSLNSLGFAALIICFADPFQASSVGFQLSFFASGTIILVSPLIYEKIVSKVDFKFKPINSAMQYILSTFLTSVCVCVALLPVMICYFDGISLVAPIVNCFVVLASEWEMILGFTGVLLSVFKVLSFITKPVFLLIGVLSDYIAETADYFGKFRYSFVSTEYTDLMIWISGVLLMTALIILLKISVKKRVIYTTTVSFISLLFTVSLLIVSEKDTVTFTAIASGNSPSVKVSYRDKTIFIGDVYSYDCMQDIKKATDSGIDVMILPNTKNNGFLTPLLRDISYGEIVIPKKDHGMLPLSFYTTPTITGNYSLEVSDDLTLNFKYSDFGSAAYIAANGKSILMIFKPGADITKFPDEWLNADILYSVSDVPMSLECEKFGHVILSADKDRGEAISKLIEADGAKVTFTGNENVVLKIAENSLCKIELQ